MHSNGTLPLDATLDAPLAARCVYTLSPFNALFNGPFFTVSIVFMKNGQNGFQSILSVFQPVTIDTMLNKNGPF